MKVLRFKNSEGKLNEGAIVEVRGIVNKDGSMSFGEYTLYDSDFDLGHYEQMLDFFHGMCKELSVK